MNVQEEIERAISDGPGSGRNLSDRAKMEIVKRWLRQEWQHRERRKQRKNERTAFVDRPEVRQAMSTALFAATLSATQKYANEYTPELLSSSFTVQEGAETVTMAEATREQHERRAAFLEELAAGNATAAVLHRRILADLIAGGANTLEELVNG